MSIPETDVTSDQQLLSAANAAIAAKRWAEAAECFSRLSQVDAPVQFRWFLVKNLAELEEYRPGVYRQLMERQAGKMYQIGIGLGGHPTVMHITPDGRRISLSPGNDPAGSIKKVVADLPRTASGDTCIALAGIGDGYLLKHLAACPPTLFMDMQQAVHLIEPDPQALMSCLMIHDFTGPAGPIRQQRFQWFTGELWADRFEDRLSSDLMLPLPGAIISQGIDAKQIAQTINEVSTRVLDLNWQYKDQVDAYYARLTPEELAEVFSPNRQRKPRVLLLTTRFTTVLQYSTRDTAEAFESLGWEAMVFIEPSPYHKWTKTAIRQVLAEFRPDVVFQIDHLRHEQGDVFPENLPFVCWIQDHLSNLMNAAAGRTLTAMDVVLTDNVSHYVGTWGYPAECCTDLNKLTRMSPQKPRPTGDGDDLCFVSNASQDAAKVLADYTAELPEEGGVRALVQSVGESILQTYADGGSIPLYIPVRTMLAERQRQMGVALSDENFLAISAWLMHPFNNSLYRKQALLWAAEVAEEQGLSLAIYGNGWQHHPELAKYARGPVQYGEPLAELSRRTKINLQIVPFLCLHQRLLDGLSAGGFFLVRENPTDVLPMALLDFLVSTVGDSAQTTADVRKALSPDHRVVFEQLLEAATPCFAHGDDPVQVVWSWQRSRLLVPGEGVLPHLSEITFHDRRTLGERVKRFIDDPAAREAIWSDQRDDIERRLTYTAGMKDVTDYLHRRMKAVAAGLRKGCAA